MATLTETAYYSRRSVVYGGIGLVLILLARVSWGAFSVWWAQKHPPPPPAPTVAFGVLPRLEFPETAPPVGVNFRLETISGFIPDLGDQAKVYFRPAFTANVLGLELAGQLARKLGFGGEAFRVDEQVYEWRRPGSLPAVLTVNLITGHFGLVSSWSGDEEIIRGIALNEIQSVRIAGNFLRSAGLMAADLEAGETRVDYLRERDGRLEITASQSEAKLTRVHFFRAETGGFSVVTPKIGSALVQVTVSGVKDKQIIEVFYRYSPVEVEQSATYPLKTPQEAWQELAAGRGYVAAMISGAEAVVRQVELAYYDSDAPQEFMQPVYVFKGDNGFVGYVPAVQDKWIVQHK